jgi:signal peptidase I
LAIYVTQIVVSIVVTVCVVVPLRYFFFEPFVVAGDAMNPSLIQGDYLIVEKYNRDFIRDDIVVYRLVGSQTHLIKRIVGLPSEKILIKDGQLSINGIVVNDKYISMPIVGDADYVLGADEYFVIGDNTANSFDSRKHGPVKRVNIVGGVLYNLSR